MPTLPFNVTDFSGGLNSKGAANLLSGNQARDLQNVQSNPAGAIVKRNGLVTLSSPADTLTSLYAFEEAGPFLVGAGGTSLYKITSGGVASTIKTGLTNNARWEFAQMSVQGGQGPLWAMNGVDTPQQWDGVAATSSAWTASSGALPNGKYMALAGNRLWVTGVAATPSRVFFSDLSINGGPRAWPAANVLDLDPNDGQAITGIGHVGPYLMVTKPRKLFIIMDFDTGANRRLSDGVGCIAHRSMAAAPEGTYFLAEDRGVYLTNGTKLTPISDLIQPTVDQVQPGLRSQAAGVYFGAHYYLSIPRAGVANDTTLDYDATLNSWWLHTFGSNQFAIWHPTTAPGLYSAKATSGIVDQCFVPGVTVDNGTPFLWRWRGPWESPSFYHRRWYPTPWYRKNFRQVRFDGSGTVDFWIAVDSAGGEVLRQQNIFNTATSTFGGSGKFGGSGVFGDFGAITGARVFSIGVHNKISAVFSATSTTADSIDSYTIMLTDRRDGVIA